MDCTHIQELMSLALDGELSEQESKEFNQHLATCNECAEEFALYQSVQADLLSMADQEADLPDGFHESLMVRISQEAMVEEEVPEVHEQKVLPLFRRIPRTYMNVAAVFALVVVFTLIGFGNLGNIRNSREDAAMMEMSTEETVVYDEAKEEKAASKEQVVMESAPVAEEPAAMMMDVPTEEAAEDTAETPAMEKADAPMTKSAEAPEEAVVEEEVMESAREEAENNAGYGTSDDSVEEAEPQITTTDEMDATQEEVSFTTSDTEQQEAKLSRDGDTSDKTTKTVDNGETEGWGSEANYNHLWTLIIGGFLSIMVLTVIFVLRKHK